MWDGLQTLSWTSVASSVWAVGPFRSHIPFPLSPRLALSLVPASVLSLALGTLRTVRKVTVTMRGTQFQAGLWDRWELGYPESSASILRTGILVKGRLCQLIERSFDQSGGPFSQPHSKISKARLPLGWESLGPRR